MPDPSEAAAAAQELLDGLAAFRDEELTDPAVPAAWVAQARTVLALAARVTELEGALREREAENKRLRLGFDLIQEKRRRQSDTYRPNRLPDYGKGWHDGYTTAMASCSLIATEATDPEGWAEHQEQWQAATQENDREWFERTGCCGHCGNPAEDCLCTDDDPCACGPHEGRRTWPRACGWCNGSGSVEPRFPRAALAPTDEGPTPPEPDRNTEVQS